MQIHTTPADPEPPSQRTTGGVLVYIGILTASFSAMAYPIPTAIGVAGITITVWRRRRLIQ